MANAGNSFEMNRESSPDIEIISEVIQKKSVEVVLPPTFGARSGYVAGTSFNNCHLMPLPVTLECHMQQSNGEFPSLESMTVPRGASQKPKFPRTPQITQVRSLRQPSTKEQLPGIERNILPCKPNIAAPGKQNGVIIPGVKVKPTANVQLVRPLNLQNGKATTSAFVHDALKFSNIRFPPHAICSIAELEAYRFQNQHIDKVNQPDQMTKQHEMLLSKFKKRKRCNSNSSSSSSDIQCDEVIQILKAPKPKLNTAKCQAGKPSSTSLHGNCNNVAKFPFHLYGRLNPVNFVPKDTDDESTKKPFVCGLCEKILCNNVSLIWHAYSHYLHKNDSAEEDLADVSLCWKCLRDFENPYLLMEHVTKIHGTKASCSSSICHICKIDLSSCASFVDHIKSVHRDMQDMPYVCSVCKFQSSLYEDIMNHFAQDHVNTNLLICPFCLLLVKESKNNVTYRNVYFPMAFSQHMKLHLEKMFSFRCDCCLLFFTTDLELSKHRAKFHHSVLSRGDQVPVVFDECRPLTTCEEQKMKNLPSRSFLKPLNLCFNESHARCIECRRWLKDPNHFVHPDSKKCSTCHFVTSCAYAQKMHVDSHEKSGPTFVISDLMPRVESILDKVTECPCGFKTNLGNKLAKHLQLCSKFLGSVMLFKEDCISVKSSNLMPKDLLSALSLNPVVSNCTPPVLAPLESIDKMDGGNVKTLNSSFESPKPCSSSSVGNQDDLGMLSTSRRLSLLPLSGRKKLERVFSPTISEASETIETNKANPFNLKNPSFVGKCRHRASRINRLKSNVDVIFEQYQMHRASIVEHGVMSKRKVAEEDGSNIFESFAID